MASKRKWDDGAWDDSVPPASANKVARLEEPRDASSFAAAADAVAATITAHTSVSVVELSKSGKEQADGNAAGVDVNNQRNVINSSTQRQIQDELGALEVAEGTRYPDLSKGVYLGPLEEVNELVDLGTGVLGEDNIVRGFEAVGNLREDWSYRITDSALQRKWPEAKLLLGVDSLRNFNVRTKIAGPTGMFLEYIQRETGVRVQVKGLGSGFVEQDTGRESDEPMYIHIVGPDEDMVARARALSNDLVSVLHREHAKALRRVQEQKIEPNRAQMQYDACTTINSEWALRPSSSTPLLPPDERPSPSDAIREQQ